MSGCVRPRTHVVFQLPSGMLKVAETVPNTTVTLPKVGLVPINLILGRPFYNTYELVNDAPPAPADDESPSQTQGTETVDSSSSKRDKKGQGKKRTSAACRSLRIVPPSELNQEAVASKDEDLNGTTGGEADGKDSPADQAGSYSYPDSPAEVLRNNRLTVDDSSRQKLTMKEIELLKLDQSGSGKEIIERIKQAHLGLDEKTEFSLAKYTRRKEQKYLRRFQLLPLDTALLADYLMDREASKIMEMRRESLALLSSWANVRWAQAPAAPIAQAQLANSTEDANSQASAAPNFSSSHSAGRWLVVDDTGGLIVAALAEKMGIAHEPHAEEDSDSDSDVEDDEPSSATPTAAGETPVTPHQPRNHPAEVMSATSNTLTLLHANHQPNLGLLQYFGFNQNAPSASHPLFHHLHTVSWLQLLHPEEDSSYVEPPEVAQEEINQMKSNKRSMYYRKRRRWVRVKRVVDATRAGDFDGLVVATTLDLVSVLKVTLPLLRGGARVVLFAPSIEPLTEVVDLFSKERKTAWLKQIGEIETLKKTREEESEGDIDMLDSSDQPREDNKENGLTKELLSEYRLDPTLLLAPTIQTTRARAWQVLPNRTHPMMTSRGGSEGYVLTSTRVLAHEGKVEAKGVFTKKRRTA